MESITIREQQDYTFIDIDLGNGATLQVNAWPARNGKEPFVATHLIQRINGVDYDTTTNFSAEGVNPRA